MERDRKRRRERLRIPENRIKKIISDRIRQELKYRCTRKSFKTIKYVGCNITFLTQFLECQFKDGMTWDNHGEIWHLDHIMPISHFDLLNIEEQKMAFHYSNLQPLYKEENLIKKDSIYPQILQREWTGEIWVDLINRISPESQESKPDQTNPLT